MNLVMAVSADGYAATSPDDTMKWTGRDDKEVFRLLTYGASRIFAGYRTWKGMPKLRGRIVHPLSRNATLGCTLEYAAATWPEATLIGGPEVATRAVLYGLIDRAFISLVPVVLAPRDGVRFDTAHLLQSGCFNEDARIEIGSTSVFVFSRKEPGSC